MEETKTMTVKEVIKHNNEILRSISLTPDQRKEYEKLCYVIDNNLICIQAMEQNEAESMASEEALKEENTENEHTVPVLEVEADAVPEA